MDRKQAIAHLRARGMNPYLYHITYDEDVITFPLYNFARKMVGYQKYRPGADRKNIENPLLRRYVPYTPGEPAYFGIESLDFSPELYVVEGVFKAAKLHTLGLSAVAVLGSDLTHRKTQLKLLGRDIRVIGDNDTAGKKFAAQMRGGRISPKDLDEMTDNEVKEFLNEL